MPTSLTIDWMTLRDLLALRIRWNGQFHVDARQARFLHLGLGRVDIASGNGEAFVVVGAVGRKGLVAGGELPSEHHLVDSVTVDRQAEGFAHGLSSEQSPGWRLDHQCRW